MRAHRHSRQPSPGRRGQSPFVAAGVLGVVGLLAALGGLAGCSDADGRPGAWPYLSPAIFQPSCATVSCHSRSTAVAGLDFSEPDRGYASLTALSIWIVDPD